MNKKSLHTLIAIVLMAIAILGGYIYYKAKTTTIPATENQENFSKNSPENSENTKNSENISEKNSPKTTLYEVTAEKSYFYEKIEDSEPSKKYVMRGDNLTVNHEKSSENKIFAEYYHAPTARTTMGYVLKSEIQPNAAAANITSAKCHHMYDFVESDDVVMPDEFKARGKIRFHFGWSNDDCINQKDIPIIVEDNYITNFYKNFTAYIHNGYYEEQCDCDTFYVPPFDFAKSSIKSFSHAGQKIEISRLQDYDYDGSTCYGRECFGMTPNIWLDKYGLYISIGEVDFQFDIPNGKASEMISQIENDIKKYFYIEYLPFVADDKKRVEKYQQHYETVMQEKVKKWENEQREKEESKKKHRDEEFLKTENENIKNMDLTRFSKDDIDITASVDFGIYDQDAGEDWYEKYGHNERYTQIAKINGKFFPIGEDEFYSEAQQWSGYRGWYQIEEIIWPKKFRWSTSFYGSDYNPETNEKEYTGTRTCVYESDISKKSTKELYCKEE